MIDEYDGQLKNYEIFIYFRCTRIIIQRTERKNQISIIECIPTYMIFIMIQRLFTKNLIILFQPELFNDISKILPSFRTLQTHINF